LHRKARAIASQAVLRKGVPGKGHAKMDNAISFEGAKNRTNHCQAKPHFERKMIKTSANTTMAVHFTEHRTARSNASHGVICDRSQSNTKETKQLTPQADFLTPKKARLFCKSSRS
jgi:hypothetical protein